MGHSRSFSIGTIPGHLAVPVAEARCGSRFRLGRWGGRRYEEAIHFGKTSPRHLNIKRVRFACARCHDHRFDPISQRDYTALAGIFLSTETKYGTPGAVGGRNRAGLVELPAKAGLPVVASGLNAAEIQQKRQKLERLQQQQRSARAQRANGGKPTDGLSDFDVVRISTQVSQLEFELSFVNEDGSAKALAMGVSDRPISAPQTRRPGPGRPMPGGRPNGAGPGRPMPPDGPRQPAGPMQQSGEPMAGGARDATNVPSQALFMLNSDFVAEQSEALADLVLKTYPGATPLASSKERLRFVFRRILNRDPSETESMAAETLVKATNNSRAAWTSVVRGLFGSAEFRFVD